MNNYFPRIDLKETGLNIKRMMDKKGYSVKDIQTYLQLGSVQSIYQWLKGKSLPSVDNLYALACVFGTTVDSILCGNREYAYHKDKAQMHRIASYYYALLRIA